MKDLLAEDNIVPNSTSQEHDVFIREDMKKKKENSDSQKKASADEQHTSKKKDEEEDGEKKDEKKLDNIVKTSQKTLFQFKTRFPFDLFPDTIKIGIQNILIINHEFIGTEREKTISMEDIKEVIVSKALFLATLEISYEGSSEPIKVRSLKPSDAEKAKRIIDGFIMAKKKDIEISKIDTKETAQKLSKLGNVTDQ